MKVVIIKLGIMILNVIYLVLKLLPVQNRVVFISRQSNEPSFEFEMVKGELLKLDDNLKVTFLCKTLDGGMNSSIKGKVLYSFHMLVQIYYLATSKIAVLDSYCIAVSILHHRKSLKIIQMWHSMGTMKQFGYQITEKKEGTDLAIANLMKMHKNYSYIFCASESYKAVLAEGFGCPINIFRIYPLPRLDLLKSSTYKHKIGTSIYNLYPTLKSKKNILYIPTFRKDEVDHQKAVNKLIEELPKDYNLIIKLHPLSQIEILNQNVFICKEFSSFDMLFVADYIISDYSCIVYEGAVLGVPLYFYDFDFEDYIACRGLTIDYHKEIPGISSHNPKVIYDEIVHGLYDNKKLREFADKYIEPRDHATRDIAHFILEEKA